MAAPAVVRNDTQLQSEEAIAQASRLTPYSIVGVWVQWFSPVQPVVKGSKDNQNSR